MKHLIDIVLQVVYVFNDFVYENHESDKVFEEKLKGHVNCENLLLLPWECRKTEATLATSVDRIFVTTPHTKKCSGEYTHTCFSPQ